MDIPLSEENIVAMLGLVDLPLSKRTKVIAELAELIQKRVIVRLAGMLSREDMETFLSLLELQSNVAVSLFLDAHIPDFKKIVGEEALSCKHELLDVLEDIKK